MMVSAGYFTYEIFKVNILQSDLFFTPDSIRVFPVPNNLDNSAWTIDSPNSRRYVNDVLLFPNLKRKKSQIDPLRGIVLG